MILVQSVSSKVGELKHGFLLKKPSKVSFSRLFFEPVDRSKNFSDESDYV